jgi:alpha-beta hydrolase superfamily lysophospholipase
MKLELICQKPKDKTHAMARAYGTSAVIFPNMAHDVMLEKNRQAVADRILEFLQERGL